MTQFALNSVYPSDRLLGPTLARIAFLIGN